jgi:methionyl-tRNA formyltransferase
MHRWLSANHEIAAYVISHKPQKSRWRRDFYRTIFVPFCSLGRLTRQFNIPLRTAPRDLEDREFAKFLASLNADILISVAFPNRIPQTALGQFRCGGLNLHPALLPEYRGPNPIHMMAIDAAFERCAGVTLHVITGQFDEGPIIAQAPATREDISRAEQHSRWFARIGADLLVKYAPEFCAGRLIGKAQPKGNWRYARLSEGNLRLTRKMDVKTLMLRSQVLGPTGRLQITLDGKTYKVASGSECDGRRVGHPPRISFTRTNGSFCCASEFRTAFP